MDSQLNVTLSLPDIADNQILLDAIETPLGWLSFGLTARGLRGSTFMYPNRTTALEKLSLRKDVRNFNPVPGDTETFASLLEPWRDFFGGFFRTPSPKSSPGKNQGSRGPRTVPPVDESNWTDFTRKVYHHLQQLPSGETLSYGEVAAAVGHPGAARAVGGLMKKNPIPPVVPCHRVVGGGGKIGGFSADGGLQLKFQLLQMEGALLQFPT